MIESGVIVPDNLEDSKIALVYGQMNEPPGARMRIALTGLSLAEQFRDDTGSDVLFFVDNIFRFTQAGSEVSALTCSRFCSVISPFRTSSRFWAWTNCQKTTKWP